MSKHELEQPIEPTDRAGVALRFSVRQFGARAHQVSAHDRQNYRTFGGEGGSSGPCRVLVQNFKPLTPRGKLLQAGAVPESVKFFRGF